MRSLLLLFIAVSAFGQSEKFNHVQWKLTFDQTTAAPGAKVVGKLEATVDPEWHMYSLTTPPGPIPTTIKTDNSPAVDKFTIFEPPPIRKFDPNFNADTETYEGAQTFLASIELKKDLKPGPITITFIPRYQTCSGTSCIPPRTRTVSATLNIAAGTPVAAVNIPSGYIEAKAAAARPVGPSTAAPDESSLASFLALAFGFGLLAIFTPCVFPMIPITMSYFIGQQGGVRMAVNFCLGIVFCFSAIGLILALALGPAAVVQLGSNAWVNGFIAAIFFAFGLSLLGAFEITIPSGLLTKLNAASGQGGFLGSLLMGLTFSLASFACVGPFMGTLLAASVGADKVRPVLGMLVFATGLALPFFLLALFPKYLKKLPRSGEWLSRVKVVMGFIVLAAMLKYLYSLDAVLQTGFLTRERFLAAWVVLFGMAGFYLLGFVRLPGISRETELSVTRMLLGIVLVIFGLSLVPGMFGTKLGEIEAYIPPPAAGTGPAGSADLPWIENDLPAAFAKAKAEGKMVLVNFTGYACTNCHWMKANMFTKPEVGGLMKNMVLVDLYTDGTDAASEINQKLEESKFETVAIPFYVLYDPSQNVLATFPGLTRKPEEYVSFLNTKATATGSNPTLAGAPFKTLTGAELSTTDWKGKVVVLNYWATWCVPCRSEIPEFNRMHDELKDVEIVGIEMGEEGMEAVKPFLQQNPMKYTVGLGTGSMDQLPVTIVLDRNGNTIQRFDGLATPAEIRAAIAKAQSAV